MTTTTSKTAGGLSRGRRSRRENQAGASTCKLASSDLRLSKSFAISSSHELQDPFLLNYEKGTIDNNGFSVLNEEFMPKIPISHSKNITGFHSKR